MRGSSASNLYGMQIRAASLRLADDQANMDIVRYIPTLHYEKRSKKMKIVTLIGLLLIVSACAKADVTRHPLPNNSTFPISQAVEVSADTTLIYHSGTLPNPANADADPSSREYWGDTEAQATAYLQTWRRLSKNLASDLATSSRCRCFSWATRRWVVEWTLVGL